MVAKQPPHHINQRLVQHKTIDPSPPSFQGKISPLCFADRGAAAAAFLDQRSKMFITVFQMYIQTHVHIFTCFYMFLHVFTYFYMFWAVCKSSYMDLHVWGIFTCFYTFLHALTCFNVIWAKLWLPWPRHKSASFAQPPGYGALRSGKKKRQPSLATQLANCCVQTQPGRIRKLWRQ